MTKKTILKCSCRPIWRACGTYRDRPKLCQIRQNEWSVLAGIYNWHARTSEYCFFFIKFWYYNDIVKFFFQVHFFLVVGTYVAIQCARMPTFYGRDCISILKIDQTLFMKLLTCVFCFEWKDCCWIDLKTLTQKQFPESSLLANCNQPFTYYNTYIHMTWIPQIVFLKIVSRQHVL